MHKVSMMREKKRRQNKVKKKITGRRKNGIKEKQISDGGS